MSMVTFDPLVLIDEAFERAGYNLSMVTGRQYESALVSLEMALIDIQNYGTYHIHELTETTATQTVTAGQTTLNTSDAMRVINSITATAADGSVRTLQLASLSDLQNYTSSTAAVPTHYAQTGSQPVTVSLWPTPTGDVSLDIKGLKFLVGPDSAFDSVMPVPRLWLDALAASLALNLCRKTPMPARDSSWQATLSMLAQQKEESIERARRETYDRGAITINAGYGSSRRKSRNTTYGSDQSSGTIGPIGPVGPAGPVGQAGPAGADGLGWTGVTYDSSTGRITFSSDDGLDYVTDDLRPAGGSGISNVAEDLSPQLGGNLDLNGNDITGTGQVNITGTIAATGEATIDGVDIGTGPGTGANNMRVGEDALSSLTTGFGNVAVGYRSGENTTSQFRNSFVGTFAGLNSTGSDNTAVGDSALLGSTSASNNNYNTAIGSQSLGQIISGDDNTAVGRSAGLSVTTGSYNTMIGRAAYSSSNSVSHEITLGDDTYDKSFRIPGSSFYINGGSEGTTGTRVGVNTASPTEQLHVNGDARVDGTITTNTISSSSDIVLDAGNRVSVQGAVPFRLPNVTTTQRNAITGAAGDMVFNTTTSAVEVYNGTAWVAL